MSELSEESKRKLEDRIVKSMAENHVPGLSIALLKDGKTVYARGFGARNLQENTPVTPDTLYGMLPKLWNTLIANIRYSSRYPYHNAETLLTIYPPPIVEQT